MIKTYFVELRPQSVFGSVGRCGGGYNTVWDDWTPNGRKARDQIIREFEKGLNEICGHYTKLEASILSEGMRNPLIITCGMPMRRTIRNLPPEIRTRPQSQWLLLEGTTGGSRLWVAQKHNLAVPCIVNDRTGRFEGSQRIKTIDDARKHYRDPPAKLIIDDRRGLSEIFDTSKVGHHLGPEWSEEKIIIQRAPLWVKAMNKHGYYVDRLPAFVNEILKTAGVIQPENLKKRLPYK
jgi:hypothetical protein